MKIPTYAELVELAKQPSEHSRLGWSSWDRICHCTASPGLIDVFGGHNTPNDYAIEGTIAHSVGYHRVDSGHWPEGTPDEMRGHLQWWVDFIVDRIPPTNRGSAVLLEKRYKLPSFHPDLGGTSDAIIWNAARRRLTVADLKYGKSPVDPWENPQLLGYALGAVVANEWAPLELELAIVQPRVPSGDPVKIWEPRDALGVAEFATDVTEIVSQIDSGNTKFVEGKYCFFCAAKSMCPLKHEKAMAAAREEFEPVE